MKRPLLSAPPSVVRALRRLSVRKRGALFLFSGLLLVFLVFGGLGVYSVRNGAQRVSDWTLRSARVTAQRLGDHLQHERDGVEHLARWPGIASSIELLQSGRASVAPPWVTLHYLASDPHDFGDCVFVTDRNSTVMWTKPPGLGLLGNDLSAYPEIQAVLARGDTYTSNLVLHGFWPEPHILIATPLRNRDGEIVGIVGNVIGAERLRQGTLFAEVKGLSDEISPRETYVVDDEGLVVTASDPQRAFTRVEDKILLSRIRQRQSTFSVRQDGMVEAVHPISPGRWSLVLVHSATDLYRDTYQLERNLLAVGLLMTLVALVVWLPLVESFASPIRRLMREAERIASGNLSHPIHIDGRDEMTTLSAALDYTREQLEGQRKTLQTQIVELTQMNRLKNEFIANLSHEFRTPVHIIRGYVDLILEGSFGEVPDGLREPLMAVSRQYQSLWTLLESCLDLAKIDAGEVRLEVETFDVCALVREVVGEFQSLLQKNGLRIVTNLPARCWLASPGDEPNCRVRSDRSKLQRILRNLLSNAVKFTEEGEVEVSAADGPGPDSFTLRVRDTGIGIGEEDQKVIFDRFRQLDGSSTRLYGGVGLGLSICSELTHLLGGTIALHSVPGEGSTFSVTLPRILRAETTAPADIELTKTPLTNSPAG